MSVAKFSEITDHSQRDAYVHQLLHDELDSNTFKSAQTIADELKAIDGDSLFQLAEWVITSMASWKSGDFMDDRPVMEFETAYQTAKNELQASEDQLRELDIIWLTRLGAESYDYEGLPQEVRDGYEARLTAFLGEDSAIDTINSMERACEVAFTLFSGKRRLISHRFLPHLNHVLHVAEEGDLATVQYVMHTVRQKQREHFRNHGFLKESSTLPIPLHTVDSLKNRNVEVLIVGGRRLIQSFIERQSDGYRFDEEAPGLRVYIRNNQDTIDLSYEALMSAQNHCDEAVIHVASVAEKYLVPNDLSNHLKIYPEALPSLIIHHTVRVPYSPVYRLTSEGVFETLRRRNIAQKMYIDPSAEQHKPVLTKLLGTSASEFEVPILPPLKPNPPPTDEPESDWTTYAKGAAVILGVFLAYKYVIRPNYPKLIEWWNARKAAPKA